MTEEMGKNGLFTPIWKQSWMLEVIFLIENYQVWFLPRQFQAKLVQTNMRQGKKNQTKNNTDLCSSNSFK